MAVFAFNTIGFGKSLVAARLLIFQLHTLADFQAPLVLLDRVVILFEFRQGPAYLTKRGGLACFVLSAFVELQFLAVVPQGNGGVTGVILDIAKCVESGRDELGRA